MNIVKIIEEQIVEKNILEDIDSNIINNFESIFEIMDGDNIPILGKLYKTSKFAISIPDKILFLKIIFFLNRLKSNNISYRTREKFYNKYKNRNEKIGYQIINIIDKSDSNEKANLLGEAFSFCLLNRITYTEFIRISRGINMSHIEDILNVTANKESKVYEENKIKLMNSGFVNFRVGKTWDDVGEVYYEYNKLGEDLIEIVKSTEEKSNNI